MTFHFMKDTNVPLLVSTGVRQTITLHITAALKLLRMLLQVHESIPPPWTQCPRWQRRQGWLLQFDCATRALDLGFHLLGFLLVDTLADDRFAIGGALDQLLGIHQ